MGQLLHGCATTTTVIRRAIQSSQESLAKLTKRYGLNPKTISKWKRRSFTHDMAMGPKIKRSSVLTREQEALVVAFRKHTFLSLDDCLYSLQNIIPTLTRSNLHRCWQRHGISKLLLTTNKVVKKKFNNYPIGYFHIDIAQVQTEEGKIYLFVAIDRTSKFCHAEIYLQSNKANAVKFLEQLIEIVPYKIHTILTDNGIQFTNRIQDKYAFKHAFDRLCAAYEIEHRLTKINHPWTNGQVERMNRTLKEATVKKYYYANHEGLKTHLKKFLVAYNFAKRLKTLKGLTPYDFIVKKWTQRPTLFIIKPNPYTLGLNT